MKILTPGYLYELQNFEEPDAPAQMLQFIHKKPIPEGGSALRTLQDGTTNEEVLLMLIDRMGFLMDKLPSRESSIAFTHLEEALMWLEKRTAGRKARGVEGTHQP